MKIIAYYRQTDTRHRQSGFDLVDQRSAAEAFAVQNAAEIVADYTEIEEGKLKQRPALDKAIAEAEALGANLVIAKVDSLDQNVVFLSKLDGGMLRFIAIDKPEVNQTNVSLILKRLRDVKAAKKSAIKRREKKNATPTGAVALRMANKDNKEILERIQKKSDGFYERLRPVVEELMAGGVTSHRQIGAELTKRGIKTAKGSKWQPTTVKKLMARLEIIE